MKANKQACPNWLLKHLLLASMFISSTTIILLYLSTSQQGLLTLIYHLINSNPALPVKPRINIAKWNLNHADSQEVDDILSMIVPDFLKKYKNPCWLQRVSNKKRAQKKSLQCLPYFYLVGVDKCGTTDMFLRLLRHPDILRTSAYYSKETMWWAWTRFGFSLFSKMEQVVHFIKYLGVYTRPIQKVHPFEQLGKNTVYYKSVVGDGSPTTFWDFTGWEKIPQNHGLREPRYLTPHCIYHLTPKAKFILLLRNPTDRLYSNYLFIRKRNPRFPNRDNVFTPKIFHKYVIDCIDKLNNCTAKKSFKLCMFDKDFHLNSPLKFQSGFYSLYLKEWLKVFARNQFYIVRSEDYKKNITVTLTNVFEFLNITKTHSRHNLLKYSIGNYMNSRKNDVKNVGPMFNNTRKILDYLYRPFNEELADILQDKRYLWKG